jgi:hypothetical protein
MATVEVYYAKVGKYYELVESAGKAVNPPEYLGMYEKMGSTPRGEETNRSRAPIYIFELKTLQDEYPMQKVREVEKRGGRRRKSRHRKSRRSRKTARK